MRHVKGGSPPSVFVHVLSAENDPVVWESRRRQHSKGIDLQPICTLPILYTPVLPAYVVLQFRMP